MRAPFCSLISGFLSVEHPEKVAYGIADTLLDTWRAPGAAP